MSTAIQLASSISDGWPREKIDLIKRTCAPDATDDELQMYLHVAKNSGLDPLRKQLHFMKYKGRVTMVADVNGLQERAAEEPDFEGITHAVVYEKDTLEIDQVKGEVVRHTNNPFGQNGKILGAWAIVRRKGMLPFLAMCRFEEYFSSYNDLWKSKPAVMIDKCAKSTALRLAYPKKLGGIYDKAELDKEIDAPAEVSEPKKSGVEGLKERLGVQAQPAQPQTDAGPVIVFGSLRGKLVSGLSDDQLKKAVAEADAKLPELEADPKKAHWVEPVRKCRLAVIDEQFRRKPDAIDAQFTHVEFEPNTPPAESAQL
jgi:phage recombination protein Bet